MRDAVFNALFLAGKFGAMTQPQLADVKESMLLTYEAVVQYIQANAKVTVDIVPGTTEVWGFGLPIATDGGVGLQTSTLLTLNTPPNPPDPDPLIIQISGEVSNSTGGIL